MDRKKHGLDLAVQIVRELVKTHKGNKPICEKNTFDQGVDAGLILAKQAVLNASLDTKYAQGGGKMKHASDRYHILSFSFRF